MSINLFRSRPLMNHMHKMLSLRYQLFFLKLNVKEFSWCNVKRYKHHASLVSDITHVRDRKDKPMNAISTLFVPGNFAGSMYQIVKPNVDIDFIVNNRPTIMQSCECRGITINLENIILSLKKWQRAKAKLEPLVKINQDYNAELKSLDIPETKVKYDALKKQHMNWVPILQEAKREVFEVEEYVMPLIQKVPNVLHVLTPKIETKYHVCHDILKLSHSPISHIMLGNKMNCLEFSDVSPTAYFLKGLLAELELAITYYFHDTFSQENFIPLSGTDFCKSFIKEAIGFDPYSSDHCIMIAEKGRTSGQRLNLVGGSSLETFCAYLTNMNIGKKVLPLKYLSTGRYYNATNINHVSNSLFSVVQSTNVHFCILYNSTSSVDDEFEKVFNKIHVCYEQLNMPLRVADIAAKYLNITESRRKQIEVWSPVLQNYVVCGYVSQHDDFLSQRLQITCGEDYSVDGFCGILDGVIVNAPVLIGCIMENFQKSDSTFEIPSVLKSHWTF